MKKYKYLLLSAILALGVISCNDDDKDKSGSDTLNHPIVPNKEIRGTWVATAWDLDFPQKKYDEASQKKLYTDYLDVLVANNMNAVFFQVRPMQGVFYDSQYESWSANATGTLGKAPSWDMMKFFIEEAHKRNIQFHAWFNPYRISTRAKASDKFADLDSKINPELVKDYSLIRTYNPALPEVQALIGKIVAEFLSKYDVDGIHIDDYFYPNEAQLKDDDDFKQYAEEGMDITAFRRSNVDKAVLSIRQAVLDTKPEAMFSISPAGNNTYNLDVMYADVLKWSQEGLADMIIPQLYYTTGSASTSFNHSLHWWSQFTYNNLLAVGYGINNFDEASANDKYKTNADLTAQLAFAKSRKKVSGGVMYSAKYLLSNPVDIMASIKEAYAKPTLPPYIKRLNAVQPTKPEGLKFSSNDLTWNAVTGVSKYIVYKSNGNGKLASLVAIVETPKYVVEEKGAYFVTAIGEHNIESEMSVVISNE